MKSLAAGMDGESNTAISWIPLARSGFPVISLCGAQQGLQLHLNIPTCWMLQSLSQKVSNLIGVQTCWERKTNSKMTARKKEEAEGSLVAVLWETRFISQILLHRFGLLKCLRIRRSLDHLVWMPAYWSMLRFFLFYTEPQSLLLTKNELL